MQNTFKEDWWHNKCQSTPSVYGRRFIKLLSFRGILTYPKFLYLKVDYNKVEGEPHSVTLKCFVAKNCRVSTVETWTIFFRKEKIKKIMNQFIDEAVRFAVWKTEVDSKVENHNA